jgi:hypothetical protein
MPTPAATAATVRTINLDDSQIIQQHFVYRLDTLEGMFAHRNADEFANQREDAWIEAFWTYARNVVEFLTLLSISTGRT